jgi:hypothetical protein
METLETTADRARRWPYVAAAIAMLGHGGCSRVVVANVDDPCDAIDAFEDEARAAGAILVPCESRDGRVTGIAIQLR